MADPSRSEFLMWSAGDLRCHSVWLPGGALELRLLHGLTLLESKACRDPDDAALCAEAMWQRFVEKRA
jgi:hypothetical protein